MRDSMIFYRSFYEAINELPEKNQLEIYKAIFMFSLDFKQPKITGLSKTVFRLIKPQLEANLKRFENGNKPKRKQNRSKTEAKNKQNRSKTEANNNNNNNDNNNDNENNNGKKQFNFRKSILDLGVDNQVCDDWLKVRENKKGVNTKTSFESIKSQIEKSGMSANDCIKLSVIKNWVGFNVSWIKDEDKKVIKSNEDQEKVKIICDQFKVPKLVKRSKVEETSKNWGWTNVKILD